MKRWLKKNFDWFFCEQLFGWITDEEAWSQKRNFAMFEDWFDYSLHEMVWDSVAGEIEKDEY
ncbi:MAG: hypothetical protein Q4G27_01300 [Flavobacteriaceae bacterium]|nr:hypothetical protein [Flavobacteriaceae bacterium]